MKRSCVPPENVIGIWPREAESLRITIAETMNKTFRCAIEPQQHLKDAISFGH